LFDGEIVTSGYGYTLSPKNIEEINVSLEKSAELIGNLIKNKELQKKLQSVLRLFTQSLEISQDKFRAFLFAWVAIEIFVNKIFASYEDKFISDVKNHSSKGVNKFLDRVKSVMRDKYRLADKFTLIASFLSDNIERDVNSFNEIKKQRDNIFHGQMFDEETLPVEEVRRLISVYVKKHLDLMSK